MGMAAPPYYSAEMVRALPVDGARYEVVHGELLVTPAPRRDHQRLVGRLQTALAAALEGRGLGEVLASPADIGRNADILVQPDLFVVDMARSPGPEWPALAELLLVVEVLSPSTARQDRFTKRRCYQEAGVPLYWIVDGASRQVEIWTPMDRFPRLERERLVWQPVGADPPITLDLEVLFGNA